MKILYHHRTQGRGAEGNHIVSIVTALRALGHQVDVLSPPGVDPFDPKASVPVDKAKTQTSGWSSLWKVASKHLPNFLFEIAEVGYNIPSYFKVRKAIRGGGYDLVFERYAFFLLSGAMAAKTEGCNFLLEVNEVSDIPGRARKQTFRALCRWFERRLFARCDVIHAVSSYLGDRVMKQGVPAAKVVVAPNGFDVGRLKLTRSREEMRHKMGFDASTLVIGFAGWFDHWDRLDLLVDVFAELQRKYPHVRLCLIGDGPGAREAKQKAADLGVSEKVLLTGAVPRTEVYDYLQMLDIGVLPHSNVFGSPIVMFEMMALGIPLAVPRLAPILDVHVDQSSALSFEPLAKDQLRDCIGTLLADHALRTALARAAREKLTREHTWVCTAERILGTLAA
ncbi:MAG TPA: glycosyltransferase [Steroidobacteraceae bacterium]|nr:glycosyltransferase [Steroidobacteraceae bacterium]